jgi:hypothetical protein
MEKELKPYMMSLFEYLGYAAGSELGKEVATTAVALKETIEKKYVTNTRYKGEILMYRREFLDEYFKKKIYDAEVEPSNGDPENYVQL